MIDFERARAQMVENQLRSGGVTSAPILARMRAIPRENFVAAIRRDLAYIDDIQWFGGKAAGRFMAAPVTLGTLLRVVPTVAQNESFTVMDLGTLGGSRSSAYGIIRG